MTSTAAVDNNMFAEAHATPRFNLAAEPWIPVLHSDGTYSDLSLRDFLLHAHTVVDIAEPEPLTRAGLLRFLIPLTAVLVRETSDGTVDTPSWVDRYRRNTGFTADEVAALLDGLKDRLWLYHPNYPFMQHAALLAPKPGTKTDWRSVDDLSPAVPGKYSAAWFQRYGDPRVQESVTCAQAARGLLYRRAYVLPGNAGGGDSGGTFSEAVATFTHVFRRDATSMFRTLLRNVTPEMFDRVPDGKPDGLAWLENNPRPNGSVLYQSTLTVTNVILGPTMDGSIAHIRLRRELDPEYAKEIRIAARSADRHTIFIPAKPLKGKEGESDADADSSEPTTPNEPKPLRLTPRLHRVEKLGKLLGSTANDLAVHSPFGVVSTTRLWIDVPCDDDALTIVMAEKTENPKSPKYVDAGILHVPIYIFENTSSWPRRRRGDLAVIVSTLVGSGGTSMRAQLGKALRSTVASEKDGAGSPLTNRVDADWLAAAGLAVDDFSSGIASKDEALETMKRTTLALFDKYTDPVATDPQYAKKIVKARQKLRSSM